MRLRWVLRLYPRAWRRRYEAELLALLEQQPATLRTLLDLLWSAGEAHVDATRAEDHMLVALWKDRTVRHTGLLVGLALGVVQVTYALLNNLANPDAQLNSILNYALTAELLLGPALAGFIGAWRSRRTSSGLGAALVSFSLSAALGFGTLWLVTLLFQDTLRHNTGMLQDFRRSGMQDLDAFIIEDALGATFFGGLLGLLACIVCGLMGGVLGKAARRLGQP